MAAFPAPEPASFDDENLRKSRRDAFHIPDSRNGIQKSSKTVATLDRQARPEKKILSVPHVVVFDSTPPREAGADPTRARQAGTWPEMAIRYRKSTWQI
jgi:hypothetical protein